MHISVSLHSQRSLFWRMNVVDLLPSLAWKAINDPESFFCEQRTRLNFWSPQICKLLMCYLRRTRWSNIQASCHRNIFWLLQNPRSSMGPYNSRLVCVDYGTQEQSHPVTLKRLRNSQTKKPCFKIWCVMNIPSRNIGYSNLLAIVPPKSTSEIHLALPTDESLLMNTVLLVHLLTGVFVEH